jgi:putative protease
MEETRPGQFFPLEEDGRGTYLFSSGDLCMIDHLPELIESGIHSLKIEGRMKGINYVASVVKTYREAIDRYFEDPGAYQVAEAWKRELDAISHRPYGTGFYFGTPSRPSSGDIEQASDTLQRLIGKVLIGAGSGHVQLDVRNKFHRGETVEVLHRRGPARKDQILDLLDGEGNKVEFAQPNTCVTVVLNSGCESNDLIRRPAAS